MYESCFGLFEGLAFGLDIAVKKLEEVHELLIGHLGGELGTDALFDEEGNFLTGVHGFKYNIASKINL